MVAAALPGPRGDKARKELAQRPLLKHPHIHRRIRTLPQTGRGGLRGVDSKRGVDGRGGCGGSASASASASPPSAASAPSAAPQPPPPPPPPPFLPSAIVGDVDCGEDTREDGGGRAARLCGVEQVTEQDTTLPNSSAFENGADTAHIADSAHVEDRRWPSERRGGMERPERRRAIESPPPQSARGMPDQGPRAIDRPRPMPQPELLWSSLSNTSLQATNRERERPQTPTLSASGTAEPYEKRHLSSRVVGTRLVTTNMTACFTRRNATHLLRHNVSSIPWHDGEEERATGEEEQEQAAALEQDIAAGREQGRAATAGHQHPSTLQSENKVEDENVKQYCVEEMVAEDSMASEQEHLWAQMTREELLLLRQNLTQQLELLSKNEGNHLAHTAEAEKVRDSDGARKQATPHSASADTHSAHTHTDTKQESHPIHTKQGNHSRHTSVHTHTCRNVMAQEAVEGAAGDETDGLECSALVRTPARGSEESDDKPIDWDDSGDRSGGVGSEGVAVEGPMPVHPQEHLREYHGAGSEEPSQKDSDTLSADLQAGEEIRGERRVECRRHVNDVNEHQISHTNSINEAFEMRDLLTGGYGWMSGGSTCDDLRDRGAASLSLAQRLHPIVRGTPGQGAPVIRRSLGVSPFLHHMDQLLGVVAKANDELEARIANATNKSAALDAVNMEVVDHSSDDLIEMDLQRLEAGDPRIAQARALEDEILRSPHRALDADVRHVFHLTPLSPPHVLSAPPVSRTLLSPVTPPAHKILKSEPIPPVENKHWAEKEALRKGRRSSQS